MQGVGNYPLVLCVLFVLPSNTLKHFDSGSFGPKTETYLTSKRLILSQRPTVVSNHHRLTWRRVPMGSGVTLVGTGVEPAWEVGVHKEVYRWTDRTIQLATGFESPQLTDVRVDRSLTDWRP